LPNGLSRRANTDIEGAFIKQAIAQHYLQGVSLKAMSEQLNVGYATVKNHLASLREEWKQKALFDFNLAKAEQLARIDEIERVSWENFHRSVDGSTSTTTIRSDKSASKMKTKTKPSVSDAKWLDKIQWCVEQRAKILGLYAPKKIDQVISQSKKLEDMSTEELLDLADRNAIEPIYEVDGAVVEYADINNDKGVTIGTQPGEQDITQSNE